MDKALFPHAAAMIRRERIIKILVVFVLLMLCAALLLTFSRVYIVTGASMLPGLAEGDRLHYLKYHEPARGDLVVFKMGDTLVVKRVIGLAGDTVSVAPDGGVTLNGQPLDEPYILPDESSGSAMSEVTVEQGHIFALGDNRGVSLDSRSPDIGPIERADILGYVNQIAHMDKP